MLTKFFIIECLTNMHVGSGNTAGGTIDLEVQRDEVTGLPVIFSSSLKGALREHFEQKLNCKDLADLMFGTPDQKGQIRILQAQLLSRPMRCKDRPYIMVTHNYILCDLLKLIEFLNPKNSENKENNCLDNFRTSIEKLKYYQSHDETVYIEGIDEGIDDRVRQIKFGNKEPLTKLLFGEDEIAILPDSMIETFRELPVIARNHLENGISQNLWYEEIVPHRSRFVFAALAEKDCECLFNFAAKVQERPVQIGANATIGYGYTKIYEIKCKQCKNCKNGGSQGDTDK